MDKKTWFNSLRRSEKLQDYLKEYGAWHVSCGLINTLTDDLAIYLLPCNYLSYLIKLSDARKASQLNNMTAPERQKQQLYTNLLPLKFLLLLFQLFINFKHRATLLEKTRRRGHMFHVHNHLARTERTYTTDGQLSASISWRKLPYKYQEKTKTPGVSFFKWNAHANATVCK